MAIEKLVEHSILSQIATEMLQRQNAEFIERHPTDDAQIDYYTDLAIKLFDEFEVDGSYVVEGTRKNVETWFNNKREQMELFRKHPYWCEEAKAIIFLHEETRELSFRTAKNLLHNMRVYICDKDGKYHSTQGMEMLGAVYSALDHCAGRGSDDEKAEMSEYFADALKYFIRSNVSGTIPKEISRMISKGTKISRFVRKCCEKYSMSYDGTETINITNLEDEHEPGDRTFDSLEKRYAKFADSLSTLQVKRMTLISLNFLDFMTMSNGNSWSTCHFINSHGIFHGGDGGSYHGAYKQGCLSYALDKPSFIFYTLPTDFDGNDYYRCQKLTRMCCQYSGGVLVTGKCYPNNEDGLITNYRNVLQQVISSIEEVPNRWTFSKDTSRITSMVSTADGSGHYADYTRSGQKPTISLCPKTFIDLDAPMVIGHEAYCLHCGRSIKGEAKEWMQCRKHRRKMVCKGCGKKLTDGIEYHEIGEHLYCSDCMFYCAVHGRYERVSELYGTIPMVDGEKKVCRDAMDNLAQCVDCGVYKKKSNMLHTTNGYACRKHVRKYKKCDLCGVYVPNKDAHVNEDGQAYCKSCHSILSDDTRFACVKKDVYKVGDYVVMADNTSVCKHGANEYMAHMYPKRIVKITHANVDDDVYKTSILDDACWRDDGWAWSKNCFRFALIGANDSFIGKTLAEIGIE